MRALVALVCCALCSCAASGTIAFGEHASAALYAPPVCPPQALAAAPLKTTVVQTYEDKIGFKPQLVATTTTTEPALPESQPLAESTGAEVSESSGGLIRTAFGVLGSIARGVVRFFVPLP